ncbi:hypothetical protein TNCV_1048351 [Trichonephila clavipes]|nr:hypothetical protein TNCV_1048351 [Trichonephila clavipes]
MICQLRSDTLTTKLPRPLGGTEDPPCGEIEVLKIYRGSKCSHWRYVEARRVGYQFLCHSCHLTDSGSELRGPSV